MRLALIAICITLLFPLFPYCYEEDEVTMAWLSGYEIRKKVPITGAAGAGTDYPVTVRTFSGAGTDAPGVVFLGDDAQDYPKDIRFTDDDEETPLDHCISDAYFRKISEIETDPVGFVGYQGIAVNSTHYFLLDSTNAAHENFHSTIRKYLKDGTLVATREDCHNDSEHMDNTWHGFGDGNIIDGYLYITSMESDGPTPSGDSLVMKYDPSDLSFVDEWLLEGDPGIEGVDKYDGYFWTVYYRFDYCRKYDSDFVLQATYTLPGASDDGDGHQTIAWIPDTWICGGNPKMIVKQHGTPIHIYEWTGTKFNLWHDAYWEEYFGTPLAKGVDDGNNVFWICKADTSDPYTSAGTVYKTELGLDFFVEVADSLESGTVYIYIYCGKAGDSSADSPADTALFFSNFETAEDLAQWTAISEAGGTVTRETDDNLIGDYCCKLHDTSGVDRVYIQKTDLTENLSRYVRAYIKPNQVDKVIRFYGLDGSDYPLYLWFEITGNLVYWDTSAHIIRSYVAGYYLRFDIYEDLVANTFDLYIDGILEVDGGDLRNLASGQTGVHIGTKESDSPTDAWVDYVLINKWLPSPPVVGTASETDVNVLVPVATADVAGLAPTLIAGTPALITAPVANVDVAGLAPSITGDAEVVAPEATATVQGYAPAIPNVGISVPLATVDLQGYAPTIELIVNQDIAVPVANIDLEAYAPSLSTSQIITAPLATADIAGLTPSLTIGTGVTVAATLGTVDVAGVAPTIAASVVVTVPTATADCVGLAPTITLPDTTIDAPVATATVEGLVPVIVAGISIAVPVADTIDLAAVAPSKIITFVDVSAPLATADVVGLTPSLVVNVNVAVPVATATAEGYAPIITVGGDVLIQVPLATATVEGLTPTAGGSVEISVPVGTADMAGLTPSMEIGCTILAALATATAQAYAVTFILDMAITAPLATIAVRGYAPVETGIFVQLAVITARYRELEPITARYRKLNAITQGG